ncbi:MAG: hypothetical protein ACD_63C00167G0003 [uncultured bacterium]|nr:MAG: hypothetical protein ACD_63C00167G0003 [uncultured bacterium]
MDPFRIKTGDGKEPSRKVSLSYRKNLEWEEGFLQGTEVEEEETKIEDATGRKKLKWLYAIMTFILAVLVARTAYMQVVQGEEFRVAAEINRVRKFPMRAPRGVIYDRNRNQLVENVPSFNVTLIPADLFVREDDAQETSIKNLSVLIDRPEDEIRKIIDSADKKSYEPFLVLENIERDKALIIESKYDQVVGFQVEDVARRNYFDPNLSNIIGYTGPISDQEFKKLQNTENQDYYFNDIIGKTGIEKSYEENVKGEHGIKEIEVDASGREENIVAVKDSKSGDNIMLSIDKELQAKFIENIAHILKGAGLSKASAVAIDPRNGEVLSLVSLPSYDNNLFAKRISQEDYKKLAEDPNQPLFNRAIGGTYASGSIIKPAIGAAALQEGVIDVNTTIVDSGHIVIENKYDPNIKYYFYGWNRSGLGPVNIYTAIAFSSNPYFFQVGGGYQGFEGLGPEKIEKYLHAFGFGKPAGIDLPGEANGLVPGREWKSETKNEKWSLGDTYNVSIGQGDFLCSPVQVANYIASISNGGVLYEPHVVKEIFNEERGDGRKIEPKILNQGFVDRSNINIIRRAMRESVINDRGTARSLSDLPVAVAAKTGTAQFEGNSLEHSWFVAFAPYDDPQIAIAVLVEGGGSGAEASAIIARDVLNWYFSR